MEKSKLHINGADGFRAIACLLVLYHHLTQKMNPDSAPDWFAPIHHFGMRGEVGVSSSSFYLEHFSHIHTGVHFSPLNLSHKSRTMRLHVWPELSPLPGSTSFSVP